MTRVVDFRPGGAPDSPHLHGDPRFRVGQTGPLVLVLLVLVAAMSALPPAPIAAAEDQSVASADGDGMDAETRVKIDRHMKAAEAAVAAGQSAAALKELRSANSLVKRALGSNHPATLPMIDMAADILVGDGQFAEAAQPAQRAVELRRLLLTEAKGDRVLLADLGASLVLLARVKSAQGALDEAATLLADASTRFAAALEPDSDAALAARRALADMWTGLGDHVAAEKELVPVVERLESREKAASAELLSATTALARAIWFGSRHDEARERLSAAIARYEQADGPRDALPESLAALGEMELAAGDAATAGIHWRQCLEIRQATLGEDQAATWADRLRIVRLELLSEETNRATASLESASEELTALAARGDPQAPGGLRSAAGIWLGLGNPTRATKLLRQALESDRAALGAEHADAAADEAALGRCLLDEGESVTARQFLEHARTVLSLARGPGHPETLAAVATLGAAAAAAGDRAAAEDCLATLLERESPWIDERNEADLRSLAEGLGGLADAEDDLDAGVTARLAVVSLRRRQFGASHPRVVANMVAAADARRAAGAFDDAAAFFEQSLAIAEATLSPDHPDVAAILVPLARTYRSLGDNAAAQSGFERALAIWEKCVGESHPATLATLKSLALARLEARDEDGALPLMERLLAAYDADPQTDQGDVARLLRRLSAMHESRGDADKAVALLARAEEIDTKLGTAATEPGQPAADAARLARLFALDDDVANEVDKARAMVLDIKSSRERLARAAGEFAAADPASAVRAESTARTEQGATEPAPAVNAAWNRYRDGKSKEAIALVRQEVTRLEALGGQRSAAQQSELAELLATIADLRPQVLDWNGAARLYERAALLEEETRGADHAVTLTRMLALADTCLARGERQLAGGIVALVTAAVSKARGSATPTQTQRLGQALAGSIRVALAAGDRAAATRLVDPLVEGWSDDEALVAAAIDALVMMPDCIAPLPASQGNAALAEVVSRAGAAATRLAATSPTLAGLGLHATAIAAAMQGDLEGQRIQLEQALDTDRRVFGRSHPRVALHLLALVDLEAQNAQGNTAADLLAEVREIESAGAQAGVAAVSDLCRLAARRAARGELDAASDLLKAAFAAETKDRAGNPLVLAAISAESGAVKAAEGKFDRAEELLTEAVSLAQTAFGAGHPDTVAHAVRRDRIKRAASRSQVASTGSGTRTGTNTGLEADGEAGPPAGTSASSLAKLLREGGQKTGPRKPARGGGRTQAQPVESDVAAGGAERERETNRADPLPAASSAQADKARRAFDSALGLYGGDPKKKKKKAGAGRQGLESFMAYTAMVEDMAVNSAGGSAGGGAPTADEPSSRRGTAGKESARPVENSAAVSGTDDDSPASPRPSPFVAASKSGLRQRTVLAKRRAAAQLPAAVDEPAEVTVEMLMRAAWSSHFNGNGEDAAAACDEAVALAGRQGGDAGPQFEGTLDQAAAIAAAQGDYARARSRLERLGSLLWKRLGKSDPRVNEVALRLASLLADCGEYDRARTLYDRVAESLPDDATDPEARAEAALVRGRIELGRGNAGEAARAARRAAVLLGQVWDRADHSPEAAAKLVRLRLAAATLMEESGDVVTAREEIDRVWLSVQDGQRLAFRVVEMILAAAARGRRLEGDPVGATSIAAQGVAMVQRAYKPCPATAAQLAELALARRAAGDSAWEEPAREATRILAPATRRMTAANCDPVAIDSLRSLASAWLEAGRFETAADASAAAQLAAGSLPPTHPTARRVARLAARVALEKGDVAKAESLLAVSAARRPVLPLEPDRDAVFLTAVLRGEDGTAAREAVSRRRRIAAEVSDPKSKPRATATPPAPKKPAAAPAAGTPNRPKTAVPAAARRP